jgi:predicted ABC-type transport system involved in lysophospholipase L1 biosynthesis ATPase subunit
MKPTPAILTCTGLTKTFPSGERLIEVLNGVDLELHAGEGISIRGESGSGKTTLLNLLAGLEAPDAGTLVWNGQSALGMTSNEMARIRASFIGLVFQAFYLIPELNALENVLISRRVLGGLDASAKTRAHELLERVGLSERLKHLPSQLSGGERQRVALARALLNGPRVIFADEPTGNLDEATGNRVIEVLLRLCREEEVSLVLVTHNREHAGLADRQLLLHEGRMANDGEDKS